MLFSYLLISLTVHLSLRILFYFISFLVIHPEHTSETNSTHLYSF